MAQAKTGTAHMEGAFLQVTIQAVRCGHVYLVLQAVVNTVLVIGIVGASTLFLLLLNSSLAEISKVAYR